MAKKTAEKKAFHFSFYKGSSRYYGMLWAKTAAEARKNLRKENPGATDIKIEKQP